MPLEIGMVVEGVVTKITEYGAFISLPEANSGMIHISEIAGAFVKDIKDYLKEGETVKVKILKINETDKYDLSLKQAESTPAKPKPGFEDLMNLFLKESKERQLDIKKNTEAKRGRGRAR